MNQFKFKTDLLGTFKIETTNNQPHTPVIRQRKYIRNGCSMMLTGIWHLLNSFYFIFLGLGCFFIGLVFWVLQTVNQSFELKKLVKARIFEWKKNYSFSVNYKDYKQIRFSRKTIKEN